MSTTAATKQAQSREANSCIRETKAQEIFIPEEFNEEQRMIYQQCRDFLAKEVWPRLDEIDSMKDPKLMPSILDKAGELGLLGTSVPQELGGFGMDFNTTMLVAEVIGGGHSVAVALVCAHRYRNAARSSTMVTTRRNKNTFQSLRQANGKQRTV